MPLICLPGNVVEGLVTRDCVPKESLDCWLEAVRPVERRGGILGSLCWAMMSLYVGKVCSGLAMCPVCSDLSRDEVEGLRKGDVIRCAGNRWAGPERVSVLYAFRAKVNITPLGTARESFN